MVEMLAAGPHIRSQPFLALRGSERQGTSEVQSNVTSNGGM